MDAYKIIVKFFVEDASRLKSQEFVPVFHSWIQSHAVSNHLLVDVADYSHVHHGPGVVLVAQEANFYLDELDGSVGFTYSRKQSAASLFYDRLLQATREALDGCRRLEADATLDGRIRFRTNELSVRLNDRLFAPNTAETFEQVRADLERLGEQLYPGGNIDIEHIPAELTLFEARLRADQSPCLATLRERLS